MIQVFYKGIEITGITTACRMEKSISAAGAQAQVTAICTPLDVFMPKINPACGNEIIIRSQDEVMFAGTIERLSFSSDALTVTMVCFDKASALAKNELYGSFSGTAASVAQRVCHKLGLPTGGLWQKPGQVFIPAGCAMSCHSIIRQAYDGRCVILWQDDRLSILEPGAHTATMPAGALLGAVARHSVESMVNRAEIIGYKGRKDAVAQNGGDIAAYGLRQKVYSLAGARSTAARQAKSHLRGRARQAEVTLLEGGSIRCGQRLDLDLPDYGITGGWIVSAVSHEVSNGMLLTSLSLEEAS